MIPCRNNISEAKKKSQEVYLAIISFSQACTRKIERRIKRLNTREVKNDPISFHVLLINIVYIK